MGRNKLKSFGPLMCQMAMLVNVRSGSFFFKALGITLLFMAGFPDDLVQRETKYRNLDLLQKYYRYSILHAHAHTHSDLSCMAPQDLFPARTLLLCEAAEVEAHNGSMCFTTLPSSLVASFSPLILYHMTQREHSFSLLNLA